MKEKVILNKEKFLNIINEFDSVRDFEITELKNISILKIKSASLDDQIRAQELSISSITKNIFQKNEEKTFHPKTLFEIDIFYRCIIEPKFTMEEVVRISKVCPELINKVCTFALGIKPGFDSLED